MGNLNSQPEGLDLTNSIQRQSEFEHWKKLGNDMAVSALQHSDQLSWKDLDGRLKQALEYYEKTPSLKLLYGNDRYCSDQAEEQQTSESEEREQIKKIIEAMNSQSYYGFNYTEEILRVHKNKAVCLRALIQNIYIQIQASYERKTQNFHIDLELVFSMIIQFIENQNMSLRFVVDQLSKDQKSGQIGSQDPSEVIPHDLKPSTDKASNCHDFCGPGPGGSPATIQPPSFAQTEKGSFPQRQRGPQPEDRQLNLSNGGMSPSDRLGKWEKRFLDLISSCQFLFQDKFLKNLLQHELSLAKKLYFYERLYSKLSPDSYDFNRMISWMISKTYYKKSVFSQNGQHLKDALAEVKKSKEYLDLFRRFTYKMQENPILSKVNYLDQQIFVSTKQIEEHTIRIENHLSILSYQQRVLDSPVRNANPIEALKLRSPSKLKMIINMKEWATNIDQTSNEKQVSRSPQPKLNLAKAFTSPQHRGSSSIGGKKPSSSTSAKLSKRSPKLSVMQQKGVRKSQPKSAKKDGGPVAKKQGRRQLVSPKPIDPAEQQVMMESTDSFDEEAKAIPGPFQATDEHFIPGKDAAIKDDASLGSYFENLANESLKSLEKAQKKPEAKTDAPVISTPDSDNRREKVITKIEVQQPTALLPQSLIPHKVSVDEEPMIKHDHPVNLEIQNQKVPYYLRDKKRNLTRRNLPPQPASPREHEIVRVQKMLKQKPQSYQQKMIQERMMNKIRQQHDEILRKNIHEMTNQSRMKKRPSSRIARDFRSADPAVRSLKRLLDRSQSSITPRVKARGKKKTARKTTAADDLSEGGSTSKSLYSFSGLMKPSLRVKRLATRQPARPDNHPNRVTSRTPVLRKNTPLSSKERLNLSGDGIVNKPIGTGPKFSSPQATSEIRDIRISTSEIPAPEKPGKMSPPKPVQMAPPLAKSYSKLRQKKPPLNTRDRDSRTPRMLDQSKGNIKLNQVPVRRAPKRPDEKARKSPMMTASMSVKQLDLQRAREAGVQSPQVPSTKVRRKQPTPTAADLFREAAIRQAAANPPRKAFRKSNNPKKATSPVQTPPQKARNPPKKAEPAKVKVISHQPPTPKQDTEDRTATLHQQESNEMQRPRTTTEEIHDESDIPNENLHKNVSQKDFLPIRKLGRGSFGDVYLVKHKQTGRLFAMKTLSKRNQLEDSWLRYVRTERYVLAFSDNPFIIKLHYAFQSETKLFLVIDFCPGGDLETMLSDSDRPFSEDKAKFYIAEIVVALGDLHSRNIIYRDLKPDNVVIDDEGHAQLIDFGMAKSQIKEVQRGARTFCGSVKYLAPEMLKKIGHGQSLDWYLLGVLLYEMIIGVTPYFSNDKDQLFENIINGKLKLPRNISPEVKHLIISLLNRNPSKRLGSKPGSEGALEIMKHPFFAEINWEDLIMKKATGYYKPTPPKYRMEDYLRLLTLTEFSNEEIDNIFNGVDQDSSDEDYNVSNDEERNEYKPKPKKKPEDDSYVYTYVEDWEFVRGAPLKEEPSPLLLMDEFSEEASPKVEEDPHISESPPAERNEVTPPKSNQTSKQTSPIGRSHEVTPNQESQALKRSSIIDASPIASGSSQKREEEPIENEIEQSVSPKKRRVTDNTDSKTDTIQKTPNFTIDKKFDIFTKEQGSTEAVQKFQDPSLSHGTSQGITQAAEPKGAGGMSPPVEILPCKDDLE